jgi:hypothetical protein
MSLDILAILAEAMATIRDREAGGATADAGPTQGLGTSTSVALFGARPLHIPDLDGGSYKSEVVVYDGPGGTIKINYWGASDPREELHNHPFRDENGIAFMAYILAGGYTDKSIVLTEDGTAVERVKVFRAGDTNVVPYNAYHTVYNVLPGTVTIMVCGPRFKPANGDAWGYIIQNPGTNLFEKVGPNDPRVANPNFLASFKAMNPHRR